MKLRESATAERIRELLRYDPEGGGFVWLKPRSAGVRAGDSAGCGVQQGYVQIAVDGVRYRAHRLAWLWMTGHWPSGVIDHINADTGDNRWANLRDVSKSVNQQNQRRAYASSTTGFMGVSPEGRKFKARIRVGGERLYLGLFPTAQLAYEAYLAVKRQFHEGNTL